MDILAAHAPVPKQVRVCRRAGARGVAGVQCVRLLILILIILILILILILIILHRLAVSSSSSLFSLSSWSFSLSLSSSSLAIPRAPELVTQIIILLLVPGRRPLLPVASSTHIVLSRGQLFPNHCHNQCQKHRHHRRCRRRRHQSTTAPHNINRRLLPNNNNNNNQTQRTARTRLGQRRTTATPAQASPDRTRHSA